MTVSDARFRWFECIANRYTRAEMQVKRNINPPTVPPRRAGLYVVLPSPPPCCARAINSADGDTDGVLDGDPVALALPEPAMEPEPSAENALVAVREIGALACDCVGR